MADDFEKAILFSFDQSGRVNPAVKAQAEAYLAQARASPDAWQLCLVRFESSSYAEVRFWCAQTLGALARHSHASLPPAGRAALRAALVAHGTQAAGGPPLPGFLKNKVAQAIVALAGHEYPDEWPTFFQDLLGTLGSGPPAVDLFCRILVAVDQDIISLDVPRSAEEAKQSMHFKDSMRERALADIADAWCRLLGAYAGAAPDTAAAVLETVQRYVHWIDIGLVANDRFVPLLFAALNAQHEGLRGAAADVLTEIVSKRMEVGAKLALIQQLGVVPVCARWRAGLPAVDEEPELAVKYARLLAALATEVLEAWKKVENSVLSMAAVGLEVDAEASSEAGAACATAAQLMDALFPAVLAALRAGHDEVAAAVVPFLLSYVARLRALQKRGGGADGALPPGQAAHVPAILESLAACARFPDDSAAYEVAASSATERVAAEEEEAAMADRRQDLFTLFRNAANLARPESYRFVGGLLSAALSGGGGGAGAAGGGGGGTAWQDVEVAVSLLYQLGETAPEADMKPGSGVLAQLAAGVMQAEVPAAKHRLVALALLETYVRYSRVLAAAGGAALAAVAARFLDEHGMGHPSEAVAKRAAYLFCRLAKGLRAQLRPLVLDILQRLQPHLAAIAATPTPEAPQTKSSGVTGGRGGAGQGLLGTVDDRLYAFEAAGLLVGQEELPAAEQRVWVAGLLQPLVARLEGNLAAAEEAGRQLAGLGLEEAGEQGAQQAAQQAQQAAQQAQQKVSLDDLFSGVWLLDGEAEPEAGAAAGADDDWDAPPTEEEEAAAAAAVAIAGESAPAVPGAQAPGVAASTAGLATRAAEAPLLGLPGDEELPGGVESDAVAAVLGAEAAAADWARKPAGPADGFAALGGRPAKRHRGEHEWAIKGHIPGLAAQWERYKGSLAKTWPFEPDVFQKEAIIHMENGRSVFVAAHTSAGKTVAAEYAFALAAKHCTRAVYTSPIKTISNQKFRDFSGQFEVGLLTGDVSIRPESACLIMTTEILRSMLYKGAELIRDIEWVIFDEVHYVNDAERGVVWEEVIIMLPAHVNLILLSATVPNVMEFADWVGRTKQKPIYVTGTTKRPVPLQHNLYYAGQLFTICQGDAYNMQGFRQAREAAKAKAGPVPQTRAEAQRALPTGRGDGGGGRGGRGGGQQVVRYGQRGSANAGAAAMAAANRQAAAQGGGGGQLRSERSQWMALIEMLRKKDLLPCVVFVFSKKRIDALADNLQSLDLTTAAEKSEIHVFCEKALARLKGGDRELPQVLRVREMLKRGLGVHHAGLLPIVKEIVEMLFCRGVIKVLFSTETFAMGVNAPARTVIFQSLRKHDGKSFRNLLPGEYTQMAGRAGRRGLDTVGTVVIACWDELPEEVEIKKMLTGAATRLESQFRLTYSMILNLLRVEDLKVEDMLKRSFAEFHAQRAQPELLQALERGQAALARLRARPWPMSPLGTTREEMEEYCRLCMDIERLDARLQAEVMATRGAQQALAAGRVVLLRRNSGSSGGGSGVTELGVICGDAPEASSSGSGSGSLGGLGGRGLDAFFGSGSSSGGASGAAEAGGSSGGRRYTVLYLHRPSPLDPAPPPAAAASGLQPAGALGAPAAAPPPAPAEGGLGGLPGEPMMRLKKKDDDDDLLMMGMGGGGKKGGKKGSGASRAAQTLSLGGGGGFGGLGGGGARGAARRALALPHAGEVGGAAFRLEPLPAGDIVGICKVKIKLDADAILGSSDAAALAAAVTALVGVGEAAERDGGDPPVLDPVTDLKLNSIDLVGELRRRASLAAQRGALAPHRDPLLPELLAVVRSEALLAGRLAAVVRQMSNANLQQLPEYHQRVKVLQRMGYLEQDQTVTMKGRVACEVNSGDELVATEIIFGGTLAELEPEEAVALLSALVFQEKSQSEPELTPRLQAAREEAVALALQAGAVQQECGLQIAPEEFVGATLNFGLAEVVYEWARGTPFRQICDLTDVMEGSIVRAMVRLDETCREFRDAARVMGNTALFQQMEKASSAIKRDVIFAASLYVA